MQPPQRAALTKRAEWLAVARPKQLPPEGDWLTWLILAGRGFGKTRTGAEDLWWYGAENPGVRLAVVAPTWSDARDTCFEGDSGILNVAPRECVQTYNRSLGELVLWNGSRIKAFSADEPERLRGPQHHRAWCFIAGTMVATPGGEVPIESIAVGDLVLTREGPRKVLGNAARQAVVGRVLFSNGKELIGTEDHPVYSLHGWTRMSDLREGMPVCAKDASNGTEGCGTPTEKGVEVTTNAPTNLVAGKGLFACIAKSGLRTVGLFRSGMMFTTRMVIAGITQSKIWSWSSTLGTGRYIGQSNAPAWIGAQPQAYRCHARTAAQTLSGSGKVALSCAGVASGAGQNKNGRLQRYASAAAVRLSAGSATSAVSVASTWRRMGVREVFCLKVEGQPEYFANGILVHNCDELAAWRYPEAWDQLLFGLRLGKHPQAVVTTTPKPTDMVKKLAAAATTRITRGSTFENADNLAAPALAMLKARYEGTRLGRQELNAEILGDLPGALWTMAVLDSYRLQRQPDKLGRIVGAVDPAVTAEESSDEHGIIVAGMDGDSGVVLEDASLRGSPHEWARRAVSLYRSYSADGIVVEVNQGGDMVAHTIRTVDPNVNIIEVRASRGKHVRAEPIAALYEQGRIKHVGAFPELEGQMTQMTTAGYQGSGSPDRVDALVWALTDLFPGITEARPPVAEVKLPRIPRGMWMT